MSGSDTDGVAIQVGIILLMLTMAITGGSLLGEAEASGGGSAYTERPVRDAHSWVREWNWRCRVQDVPRADEIICNDGTRVRLIGVTAPGAEYGDIHEASAAWARALLPRGTVLAIELDEYTLDPAGRPHVYLRLGDDRILNEMLLREGVGRRWDMEPNRAHRPLLDEAAREARTSNRGLWVDDSFRCFAAEGAPERCARPVGGAAAGG
jgi:endonuclease YncB( thermonuclease family)